MKSLILPLAIFALSLVASAQTAKRPKITAVDHVAFYTTDVDGVKKLYGETLGLASADPIESGEAVRYIVGTQWVGFSPAPDPKSNDRMDHIAFRTDNIGQLRRYLVDKGFRPSQIRGLSDHSFSFTMNDPVGHNIEFVERAKDEAVPAAPNAVSHRLIHGGFLVYDRPAEDHFYLEVLGFRPYWHGGMKDNQDDWVSIQVPDGTDWLEYMLNQSPHPDLRLSGVMNHLALGVADMKAAQAVLESHGWKAHGNEQAKLGRDGKWQLNIYDPDLTRAELMEFKPAEKPCCSDFTGPHPSE